MPNNVRKEIKCKECDGRGWVYGLSGATRECWTCREISLNREDNNGKTD